MTETEALTLQLLRQIDQKLERLLKESSDGAGEKSPGWKLTKSHSECAEEIAAMTPGAISQTDAVELLHEDRLR
jgi:hypothetical protein